MTEDLPYPDDELLMQITNTRNLHGFKESFKLYKSLISDCLARAGQSLGQKTDILDFGCGA